MKLSTEISSAARLVGEEKAVELVARAGFTAWDFSMFQFWRLDKPTQTVPPMDHPMCNGDYLAFARKLRHIGEEYGITCNQSHAPFPVRIPAIRDVLKRCIECTAVAGGKVCIIHPDNNKTAVENAEMYLELLPFAKDHGVKIATENMWNWDKEKDEACFAACASPKSFCEHIDIVGDPFLVACLDIGHAEMRGQDTSAVEMIRALGHRIAALHLHDNDKWKDTHAMPFTMDIDFIPIMAALREVGYAGDVTLECGTHLKSCTPETVLTGLTEMANTAKRLAAMLAN